MFAKILTALALVGLVHGEAHLEGSGSGVRPSAKFLLAAKECATTHCMTESIACMADTKCAATVMANEAPLAGSALETCVAAAPYGTCVCTAMDNCPTPGPTAGAATLGYFVGLVVAVAATMF